MIWEILAGGGLVFLAFLALVAWYGCLQIASTLPLSDVPGKWWWFAGVCILGGLFIGGFSLALSSGIILIIKA